MNGGSQNRRRKQTNHILEYLTELHHAALVVVPDTPQRLQQHFGLDTLLRRILASRWKDWGDLLSRQLLEILRY